MDYHVKIDAGYLIYLDIPGQSNYASLYPTTQTYGFGRNIFVVGADGNNFVTSFLISPKLWDTLRGSTTYTNRQLVKYTALTTMTISASSGNLPSSGMQFKFYGIK